MHSPPDNRTTSDTEGYDEIIPGATAPEHIELYDYLTDPGETINLAPDPAYAALVAELSTCLNAGTPSRAGDGWKQTAVNAPEEFPETYEDWKTQHQFPGQKTTLLDRTTDADGDFFSNIFEYKFGTHPLVPDSPSIDIEFLNGNLHVTYPEVEERSDVTLSPLSSTDLINWSGLGLITNPDQGRNGNAVIRSSHFSGNGISKLFLRLQAEE